MGVDGINVNDQLWQVDVFQSRIHKTDKTLGDTALKEFHGSLSQFKNGPSVLSLQTKTGNSELLGLLREKDVAKKIEAGYELRGIFVTNGKADANAEKFLRDTPNIVLYDEGELQRLYLPIDKTEPIPTPISFNVAAVNTLVYPIGSELNMVIAPLSAAELVKMEGIPSQELFAWNVRQWLRKTNVNKDIEKSIKTASEHKYFPAFHNGLTVLCESLEVTDEKITVSGYAVVNGCQSLTGLYENRADITPDLRLMTKFIRVSPKSDLASKITDHTNNQNGITARDRQSNTPIQMRLQSEIHRKYKGEVCYRVKRGERPDWDPEKVIENELAARILLAFDLRHPEAAHQQYKLFDESHKEIFGRPEVNADRIVALSDIDKIILEKRSLLSNPLFGRYGLTRFLLHFLVREALETDSVGKAFCANPSAFLRERDGRLRLRHSIDKLVTSLIRLLDGELKRRESEGTPFDYKRELKSPRSVAELRSRIIPIYQITVDGGMAPSFSDDWQKSEAMFATD
jgi:hypothetical protein